MTTVDSLGNESAKSNILTLNPATQVASPITPSAVLTWEDPIGTTVAGYKIYLNGTLIGDITDPSVHEYTTDAPLASTNVFEVTAYDSTGSETKLTSTISYTSDPTSSSSGSLSAVIISNSQAGEAPLTINFDAGASTGPISSYTWTFGDGASVTGVTASHSYQSAGTYTATLTVKDTNGQSQQAALAIAVNSPPINDSDPKAVISSSTAVGDAPFTVSFDGSGSTTSQPPITSYLWDFGDGATGEGVTVDHLYTVPGTYTSGLTVHDSAGRTDSITTPVIITLGSGQTNLPPMPSFTAAPPYGAAPLAVTFDGSASSDADGSIISYLWNFGDGITSTGVSTQHTFTGTGNYTVTLQVTDDKGVSAVSSQTVSVNATGTSLFNFELQEVQVDNNWTRFNFTQPFIDPVVVAGPPSFNGSDPATIRVRNIDSTGCEVRIQEWEYLDDVHAQETLSFIVMERGKDTLENGNKIQAGSFTGSTSFQKINLQQTYTTAPVILPQVVTVNETDAVTSRLRNTSTTSFEYMMQERELTTTAHGAETIDYIAWEPGTGTVLGLPYEVGSTAKNVTDGWYSLAYQTTFSDLPLFLAGIQTYAGSDTAAMRSQSPAKNSIQVKVEEEQSADQETTHAAEVVGYLELTGNPGLITSNPSSWIKQFTFNWEVANTDNVTGYRFYLNNILLCESTNPAKRQHSCQTALLNKTMVFTMTSALQDGSETEPIGVLSISPENYPDLFGIRLVTFNWVYDSAQETNISGFAIYNNDNLACETTDPSDRQLTCKVPLDANDNAFTVKQKAWKAPQAAPPTP